MAEETSSQYLHPRSASEHDSAHGLEPSHGISINLPAGAHEGRPPPIRHISAPAYQSPIRHHRRTPSRSKGVKETLNARSHYGSSDDDGASVHRINQYIIKQEIGRGSFGAVHLAVDQYGQEYAVKEFSKSRLRKRAQSTLLRRPTGGPRPGHLAARSTFNSPLHRMSSSDKLDQTKDGHNSLDLIKEEIAIMKKLDHNNLVSLIEVLDDPQEDSLYMVLEMCKKGVVMKVGLDERAEPYDDETCRCWFRDMILGIEYLHAQGIIHRDLKPDNCLITDDGVLKIVDFGVSEMFEKQSEMATAKSAGSPAFMPPELCVAKHGQISGRAADIWSMGVTLYCLRYGHIPFEQSNMLDLYNCIREEKVPLEEEKDDRFADLMRRTLEKDPEKRITLEDLRNHPWVTKTGTDELLSSEENCADLVEPPTEIEMNHAITGNMGNLLVVMKAVKRFKKLVQEKHGTVMEGIFGRESRLVAPPHSMRVASKSQDNHDRRPLDSDLVINGVHRDISVDDDMKRSPYGLDKAAMHQPEKPTPAEDLEKGSGETAAHFKQRVETQRHHANTVSDAPRRPKEYRSRTFHVNEEARGHAHDPLKDRLYLNIGFDPSSAIEHDDEDIPMVSESPPAVDMNIYEQAYQEEMQRILDRRGREPSMYLTRRMEHRDDIRSLSNIKDAGKMAARRAAARLDGFSKKSGLAGAGLGSAGKNAAQLAVNKFNAGVSEKEDPTASEYLQAGKDVVSQGLDASRIAAQSATEKLGGLTGASSSKSTSEAMTNLFLRAQARARGDPTGDSSQQAPKQLEKSHSEPIDAEPNLGKEDPSTDTRSDADKEQLNVEGAAIRDKPGGFPVSPAAE